MEDTPSTAPARSASKPEETPEKRKQKYYKGRKDRPMHSLEEWLDPDFKLSLPPDPDWIEEWEQRHPEARH